MFRSFSAIYVVGSALGDPRSIYAWRPADLDITVVASYRVSPYLVFGSHVSIFIVPHPSTASGLLPTPLWYRFSPLSTLLFLAEPRLLIHGFPIEPYLRPVSDLLRLAIDDLPLWIEEKLEAYTYWKEHSKTRNAAKALARAIWGTIVVKENKLITIRKALHLANECGLCLETVLNYEKPSIHAIED